MNLKLAEELKSRSRVNISIPGFKGKLYDFQTIGVAWLYSIGRGILADQCGLGKTIQALALLEFLKSRGELTRALLVVPAPSLYQWSDEVRKLTSLHCGVIAGSKFERVCVHRASYEVSLVNYQILFRDFEWFIEGGYDTVFLDEATAFKNPDTATANHVKMLTQKATRVYPMTATPIQNNLMDIHSILEALHIDLFPGRFAFRNRYCRVERVMVPRRGRLVAVPKIMGYKRMGEFKEKVEPFFLRRRYTDVNLALPSLVVKHQWLDLTPLQLELFDKLTKSARQAYSSSNIREFRVNIHYIQEVLDDAYAYTGKLDDRSSCKIDWIMRVLTTDLQGEKVVIFSRYKRTLYHLRDRLEAAGIGSIEITGDVKDKRMRYAYQKQFNENPDVRVCYGTSALEMSLNLQAARFVIFIDLMWNPARVEQVVGRIRRIGSKYSACCAVMLLTRTAFEERVVNLLKGKQGLADYVFSEQSDIFEKLDTEDLYSLVKE